MEKLVTLNNLSTFLDNTKEYILDLMYPVGSVYISVNNTNPQNLWGGYENR